MPFYYRSGVQVQEVCAVLEYLIKRLIMLLCMVKTAIKQLQIKITHIILVNIINVLLILIKLFSIRYV